MSYISKGSFSIVNGNQNIFWTLFQRLSLPHFIQIENRRKRKLFCTTWTCFHAWNMIYFRYVHFFHTVSPYRNGGITREQTSTSTENRQGDTSSTYCCVRHLAHNYNLFLTPNRRRILWDTSAAAQD